MIDPAPPRSASVTVKPTEDPVDAEARHETVDAPIGMLYATPDPATPVAVLEGVAEVF